MTEEFLVLEALRGSPFAPTAETTRRKSFSHLVDHLAFIQTGDFMNFLKSYAVGPGSPDYPVGTFLGRLRVFDSGDGESGLFWFHSKLGSLAAVWMEANGEPSVLEGPVNQAKAGFSNGRWLRG